MTDELDELLERLKEIDKELYVRLYFDCPDYWEDYIQGTIQRACVARNWNWDMYSDIHSNELYNAEISKEKENKEFVRLDSLISCEAGSTAAEALLRAYIAALGQEGEKK